VGGSAGRQAARGSTEDGLRADDDYFVFSDDLAGGTDRVLTHITLSMLALAWLAASKAQAGKRAVQY
jgi:hypothetical protein